MILRYIWFLQSRLQVKAAGTAKSLVNSEAYLLWDTAEDNGLNIRLVVWFMPGTRKYFLGVGIATQIKLVLWFRTWLPVRCAWYLQGNIEIYIYIYNETGGEHILLMCIISCWADETALRKVSSHYWKKSKNVCCFRLVRRGQVSFLPFSKMKF